MTHLHRSFYALPGLLLATQVSFAQETTHLGAAISEALQASGHASASAVHSIAASGQVTFAASAVPLALVGSALLTVGTTSVAAAGDLLQAATAPIGTPLPITDEVLVVTPPNEALKNRADAARP